MTLSAMLATLYRRTNYASSPASEITTLFTDYIAETLQEVISEPGIGEYVTEHIPPITFASVASQAQYTVPSTVSRIDSISERTNNLTLEMRTREWYRVTEPNPTINTGTPSVWVPFGYQAVASQPAAATGLWVVSTSAGDVQNAFIETVRTGGYPRVEAATAVTGVTRKALGTPLTDHIEVTKFYLSTVAIGTVSLYDAATLGNELARIPVGQTFSRYLGFALWPTPAAAITYYVDGENALPDMANATDEPPFPSRFHRILIDGSLWRYWDKKDDERAVLARKKYERGIKQLRYYVTCPPDFLPARGGEVMGRSRFGGSYPVTKG